MKTFRVEIKTSITLDAVDALSVVAEARYHFMQLCKRPGDDAIAHRAAAIAREASYDVSVIICPKCYSADCQGNCESQRRIPVIQRDRE